MINQIQLILLVIAFTLLQGCYDFYSPPAKSTSSEVPLQTTTKRAAELLNINSLVIAPVSLDKANIKDANDIFTSELLLAFQSEGGVDAKLSEVGGDLNSNPLAYLGNSKADAVLLTTIHRFEERQGSAAGSDNPAKIDFSMRILNKEEGKEVWSAIFHFKDQALLENLLKAESRFTGGNMGFKKAREVIQGGFRDAARKFAEERTAQFVIKR